MEVDCDRVSLITIKPEAPQFDATQNPRLKDVKNENISRNKNGKTVSKPVQAGESRTTTKGAIIKNDDAAKERQRTGRYLAIGVTLIMLFIAFYHTLLRHAKVLAGLLAPAIIMLLYILWLFYFAKKKKTQSMIDRHRANLGGNSITTVKGRTRGRKSEENCTN